MQARLQLRYLCVTAAPCLPQVKPNPKNAKETAVAIAQQIGLYGPQGVPRRNSAISGEETGMCIVYTIYATYIS